MEYVYTENFEFRKSQFYIEQIERLLQVANTNNKVEAWASPIVSFFSGEFIQRNDESPPLHSAIHIFALDYAEDKEILRKYFIENYLKIIDWVAFLYFYFRTVNGYPVLAKELLTINNLLQILECLENKVSINDKVRFFFIKAYSQILTYAVGIKEDLIVEKCLLKLNKEYSGLEFEDVVNLMLYRSVNSNRGNKSYYLALTFLKDVIIKKSLFDNISIINTIYLEDKEFFLNNFKVLKTRILESIEHGFSDSSFKCLINNLVLDNLVYLVQEIYFSINYPNKTYSYIKNHNFIVVNSTNFVFYENGMCKEFNNQFVRYKKLIGSQNKSLNSYTSLAFDEVEVTKNIDYSRYHVADHNLSCFLNDTVDCYRINEISYNNFESVSLFPIDTHPVQACLVLKNSMVPPLINVSFDGKTATTSKDKILCFLTRNSQTYDKELEFLSSLEYKKEIITDPDKDTFLNLLNNTDYDILYISAHGEYEHFNSKYEEIVFWNEENSESYKISITEINDVLNIKDDKKILILNICDGANCGLSYFVSERGVANKFAIKGHVVLSYLWPVEPKYAVVFSCLILYYLKNKPINQVYFDVLSLLNTTNDRIYEKLILDEKTKIWADLVLYFSGFISDSHLYSSAIYT